MSREEKKKGNRGKKDKISFSGLIDQIKETVMKIEETKELKGLKKQKLVDELNHLEYILEDKRNNRVYDHRGLKEIEADIKKELDYINKHINRMTESGGFKRSFIKGNVTK